MTCSVQSFGELAHFIAETFWLYPEQICLAQLMAVDEAESPASFISRMPARGQPEKKAFVAHIWSCRLGPVEITASASRQFCMGSSSHEIELYAAWS